MDTESKSNKIRFILFSIFLITFGLLVVYVALRSFKNSMSPPTITSSIKPSVTLPKSKDYEAKLQTPGLIDLSQDIADKYKKLESLAIKSGRKLQKVAAVDGEKPDYNALNEFENYMKTEGTSYIHAETITLWFDNFPSDDLGLEERKKIAFDTISYLRTQIEDGDMTMKQAGDYIINKPEFEKLDSAWKSNAYRNIQFAKKGQDTFLDPTVEEFFWNMNEEELSKIITGKKVDNNFASDAYYKLIKINKKVIKEFDTYEDLVNSQ